MAGSSTFTWQHALLLHSNKSPFDSPVPQTHRAFADVQPVSWQRKNIAGLLVTLYGLQEIPPDASETACLWLLHGRGDTQDSMGFCAAALIHSWNKYRIEQNGEHQQQQQQKRKTGLIVACFDQRNHGSRMVEHAHNESWKQGNATHGQDMFASYVGSVQDLSLLITLLPGYLPAAAPLTRHLCGGVSLGGHATWVALVRDPRVVAGLVVVGCPDYVRMMTDRAVRTKLPSTRGPGGPAAFVGSTDFPPSLVRAVKEFDPAGVLTELATKEQLESKPSEAEIGRLRGVMDRTLKGKKILCLSGKKDRLVPYEQGEPFLAWLKAAVSTTGGWAGDMGIDLKDIVDPDGRHEFSALMRREAEQWICQVLSEDDTKSAPSRESKI